jgi:hypothetical protein
MKLGLPFTCAPTKTAGMGYSNVCGPMAFFIKIHLSLVLNLIRIGFKHLDFV